jgi:hypothetical protein
MKHFVPRQDIKRLPPGKIVNESVPWDAEAHEHAISAIDASFEYADFDSLYSEIAAFFDQQDCNICTENELLVTLQGNPTPDMSVKRQLEQVTTNCLKTASDTLLILDLLSELESASLDLNKTDSLKRINIAASCLYLIFTVALENTRQQKSLLAADLGAVLLKDVPAHTRLLQLICQVADTNRNIYPLKKVLLLLWKVILLQVGGTDRINQVHDVSRFAHNLPPRHGMFPLGLTNVQKEVKQKVSPQEYEEYRKDCMKRHPSLTLPTVRQLMHPIALPWEMFPNPCLTCPPDGYNGPSTGNIAYVDSENMLPPTFREALKIFKNNMYISLGDVQFAEEKQRVLEHSFLAGLKPMGDAEPSFPTTPLQRSHYFMESIIPEINTYCSTFVRLLYHVHIGMQGDAKQPSQATRDVITKAVSAILLLMLKHAKATSTFALDLASFD